MSTAVAIQPKPAVTASPLVDENPACATLVVNPYRRCDLRCVYCITGVQGVAELSVPADRLIPDLEAALDRMPPDSIVTLGGHCDPYPRAEAAAGHTRRVLATLVARAQRFRVITKGRTVLRDVDLLRSAHCVRVSVSLSSVDQSKLAMVDPGAPPAPERLAMVATLHDAGITVEVNAMPWIPDVTDAAALVAAVPDGVPVIFGVLNVRDPHVCDSPFGRRYDQAEVNARYLDDHERVGSSERVRWLAPVSPKGPRDQPFRLL
jgi:DNA repair photolyase